MSILGGPSGSKTTSHGNSNLTFSREFGKNVNISTRASISIKGGENQG